MQEHSKAVARRFFTAETTRMPAVKAIYTVRVARLNDAARYASLERPALSKPEVSLDLERTALVVIDPWIDSLKLKDAGWTTPDASAVERKTVRNLARLCKASKHARIVGGVSLTSDAPSGAGSAFIPELEPFIEGDRTIICAPHKAYSPLPFVNDIGLQLHSRGVKQIILAGLIVNLWLESHLRDFLAQGFEVVVVRDAIAGPKLPGGDGYLSALINFRRIANALWTTDETVQRLG